MVTTEEIRLVPLFAGLDDAQCERLSRAAADIRLSAGEYAAPQGSEPALFAVLEGRIEPVQRAEGVGGVVGVRGPGEIFGEVPISLGTVFPVGFRAAAPARVMRIEPRDYHGIASTSPEVASEVGRLATHRMTGLAGLQGLAAAPPPPRAIVVGHRLDPATTELRRFLTRNQVTFEWLAPDVPAQLERWDGPPPAEADMPTIRVIGGKTVIRPQLRRVAELLDRGPEPELAEYDVVIVGAGPAGLAAAVYGASEGLRTIVVEREAPGGQAGTAARIETSLGFPDAVSGDDLASRALKQARRLGAEILVTRAITRVDTHSRQVHLDGGDVLRGRTIILACGVSWRQLAIEGFDRLVGKGISYGAARSEAPNVHGLDVHIVGAGNSAGQAAMFFSTHARTVTMLCRGDGLEKSMSRYLIDQLATRPNISVMTRTQIVAARGEASLEALDVRNGDSDEQTRLESGGLFIFIGADAETDWLPPEIAVDPKGGFVLTGADAAASGQWELERAPYLLETSVPGIFACGDVRFSPVKRVAAAFGEGSMAIAFVHQYLREAAYAGA